MGAGLSQERVLDLTDERGLLAGRMLGQLGADVVQVEPPGGSRARRVGPFTDEPALGRDNVQVLRDFAGYDAARIDALFEGGVLR